MLHPLHHELGDPLPPTHLEVLGRIGVHQQHLELSAVSAVDEPGGVQTGHAMLQRQTAARLDEAGMSFGDGHGEPGGDQRPTTAGGEHGVMGRREIEAGVTDTRIGGQGQFRVEAHHRDLKHRGIVEGT